MNEREVLRRIRNASDALFGKAAAQLLQHGPEDELAEEYAKAARELDEIRDQVEHLYKRARQLVAA